MKNQRRIFDRDVVDPHHPTIAAREVNTEMSVNWCQAPDHVNTSPVADPDNRR